MNKLFLATILISSATFATAANMSVSKFKKLDYSLVKKEPKEMSAADFKKLDYELCKKFEKNLSK